MMTQFGLARWLPLVGAAIIALPVIVVGANLLEPSLATWEHLAATVLGGYVVNTLWIGFGVAALTLVLGTGTAWLCAMCRFPGRQWFEWLLVLPLAMPTYAAGFTYAGMLDFAGPVQEALRDGFGWGRGDYWFPEIRSVGGVIFVFSLVLYPYVYLLARASFLNQSVCSLEIARTLGRSPRRVFFEVAIPLARPALVGGMALAVMEAWGDFGTVDYYGVDTFTTGIYRTWFGIGDRAAASQLAAVLLLCVLLVLMLEQWSRRQARYHHTSQRYRPLPDYRLRGGRAGLATAACALPVALGFLVPVGQMLAWAGRPGTSVFDSGVLGLAGNSALLAGATALIAIVLSFAIAFVVRGQPGRLARGAVRLAGLGYAIPGSVIAVGVLVPLAWVDRSVNAVAVEWLGVSTGLVLTGSAVALVFGYLVRYQAVSGNAIQSGYNKVSHAVDDVARSLGAGVPRLLARVHAPLVSGALLTAGLLVFVEVLKELPATLIMRPVGMDTLAVRAYELASDERLADSAAPCLAIVLAGLIPVILLSRSISRSRPGAGRR